MGELLHLEGGWRVSCSTSREVDVWVGCSTLREVVR